MLELTEYERETGHRAQPCDDPDCGGTCHACCLFLCLLCGQAEAALELRCPRAPMVVYVRRAAGEDPFRRTPPKRYFLKKETAS